jgi:hypothetical protein
VVKCATFPSSSLSGLRFKKCAVIQILASR